MTQRNAKAPKDNSTKVLNEGNKSIYARESKCNIAPIFRSCGWINDASESGEMDLMCVIPSPCREEALDVMKGSLMDDCERGVVYGDQNRTWRKDTVQWRWHTL